MKSVLILSTCYDRVSSYTAQWAEDLHRALIKRKDTICMLYDAVSMCRAGSMLADAIDRVEYVVFYGHGGKDQWISQPERANVQPAVAAAAVVDVGSVGLLNGKKVYAGCCWSLAGLGQAHLGASKTGFVGYNQEFDFEFSNHTYFGDVVNQSVIAYVNGDSPQKVAADLRTEWTDLRNRFSSGFLSRQANASLAAAAADRNSQRVGSLP